MLASGRRKPELSTSAVKDFVPISLAASAPSVLVISPTYPVKNVQELIDFIKQNGQTTHASAGPGSSAHLGAELFKSLTNVDVTHIPYKGAGPASIDLMSGRVTMMFDTLPASFSNIRAGKLRVLGVSTTKPVPQ